jgi:hypothetical protein
MARVGEEFPSACPELRWRHPTHRVHHRSGADPEDPDTPRRSARFTPSSRITLLPRPPARSRSREYSPARSADRHLPEAHWPSPSILSPAVTATGTTRQRPSWCEVSGRQSVRVGWSGCWCCWAGLRSGSWCAGRCRGRLWLLRTSVGVSSLKTGWKARPPTLRLIDLCHAVLAKRSRSNGQTFRSSGETSSHQRRNSFAIHEKAACRRCSEDLAANMRVLFDCLEPWRWRRLTRKTDRDDALKLARLAAVWEIAPVAIPDRVAGQWKSIIVLHKCLVSQWGRTQNHIRATIVSHGLASP